MSSQTTLITHPPRLPPTPQGSNGCAADCVHVPEQASACINVDLLGGLRVRAGRTTMGPRDLGGTKLRRVLLALILHRGFPVSKDRLVSMLWEASPPSGAKATLETYVCLLRKTLQPCKMTRPSLITTVAGGYAIDMSRVDLDLIRFEQLMSSALRPDVSAMNALPMLQQAMTLADSPLLPDEHNCEWLEDERRIHGQNVRKGRIAAASKIAEVPSSNAALWATQALQDDPLDESAWHALLQSMEASSRHADGLRAYDQCRGLFAHELGCAPGAPLQELYVRLLRGANENDTELTQLFDAVARLHAQGRLRPAVPLRLPGHERREARDQARSIDDACRSLDRLLGSFGRGR